MRLDSANRSFAALVICALLLGMYVFCGAVGCVLVPLLVTRVAHDGLTGITGGGDGLLPALLFVGLVAAGFALGIRSLRRQIGSSRRLAKRVRSLGLALPGDLAKAAGRTGLAGRVVLVDSPEWFSFAYGALTPRVAVSRGLFEGVSAEELRAVLEHERYHVRNLDPLKVMIVRTLPATFFLMPTLGDLRLRYIAGRELAADRRAVKACGRRALVSALLKVVRGPAWSELEVAAAIGGQELVELRVQQLESGSEPKLTGLSSAGLARSLLGALMFTGVFIASIVGFGGPSAVSRAVGVTLSVGEILGSMMCVVPFAVSGLLVYCWVAWRAREPLTDQRQATTIL